MKMSFSVPYIYIHIISLMGELNNSGADEMMELLLMCKVLGAFV